MKKIVLFLLGCSLAVSSAKAELRLPALFGDHMVLQRGTATVCGWAQAGKNLKISLSGRSISATVGADGKWKASLTKLKAGGPFELVVSGDGAVTFSDVLVGDVWLGSGQSNMELALNRTNDADAEANRADFPQIRLFTVEHASSGALREDVKGSWKVCSPGSVKDFSAVAYYFGKDLHQDLKIPVGMIASSWGGTPVEDWIPRPALDQQPDFARLLDDWDKDTERKAAWTDGLPYEFQFSDFRFIGKDGKVVPVSLDKGGKGWGGAWHADITPESTGTLSFQAKGPKGGPVAILDGIEKGQGWITLATPLQAGKTTDLTSFDSIAFYAKGKGKYRLKLGQASINDYNYYSTDILDAPEDWQLMHFAISSLKQGEWGTARPFTPQAVDSLIIDPEVPYSPEVASVAYNGMIAPLTPFKIKGVLWYQGEANWGRTGQYRQMLSTLITSWRKAWGIPFPFLIVQLPNYMAVKDQPSESAWAELREAQAQTAQSLPKVGFATTIDIGEAENIHPKDKKDVGDRLTRLALGMAYGKPVTLTSPVFAQAKLKGNSVVLQFKNVGAGLAAKGGDSQAVTGFALAGPDGTFHWAEAKITGKAVVEVSCAQVKEPLAVRYAWADNPICNLASKDGFPASPFRFSFPAKPGVKTPADEIPPPP
jgi:sialate O-acetylesterase